MIQLWCALLPSWLAKQSSNSNTKVEGLLERVRDLRTAHLAVAHAASAMAPPLFRLFRLSLCETNATNP